MAKIIITTATATATITTTDEMIAVYRDHIEVVPTQATEQTQATAQTETQQTPAQATAQTETQQTPAQATEPDDVEAATEQVTAKVVPATKLAVDPRLQEAEFINSAKIMIAELIKTNTALQRTVFEDEFWIPIEIDKIRDAKRIAILSDGKEEVVYDDILSNDRVRAIEKLLDEIIKLRPYYEDTIGGGFCFKPTFDGLKQQKRWDLIWE
jgi:hypothetical protein